MSARTVGRDARPSKEYSLLVVGPWYVDLIFRGVSGPLRPGSEAFAEQFAMVAGGGFTPAMALRRLGHDVTWVADFGNDPFSGYVLHATRSEGLDERAFQHHARPLYNVTAVLSGQTDRTMVSFLDPVAPRNLGALVRQYRPRMVVLPILRYDADTREGLRVARRLGVETFMDCQDAPGTLDDPLLVETLSLVDVFAPNLDEALALTGTRTLDAALGRLAPLVDTVVVTRGCDGATAMRGGARVDIAAVPVAAVDTTGAGDCFAAGFIHRRLAGYPLHECLAAAVACGAAAVTGFGSAAMPDITQLAEWSARVPQGICDELS